jgi:hypothetical protein
VVLVCFLLLIRLKSSFLPHIVSSSSLHLSSSLLTQSTLTFSQSPPILTHTTTHPFTHSHTRRRHRAREAQSRLLEDSGNAARPAVCYQAASRADQGRIKLNLLLLSRVVVLCCVKHTHHNNASHHHTPHISIKTHHTPHPHNKQQYHTSHIATGVLPAVGVRHPQHHPLSAAQKDDHPAAVRRQGIPSQVTLSFPLIVTSLTRLLIIPVLISSTLHSLLLHIHCFRLKYTRLRIATRKVQKQWRKFTVALKERKAATILQSRCRCKAAKRRYSRFLAVVKMFAMKFR